MGALRRWGRTILGTLVVLSGVAAAVLTVVARRSGDWDLTRLGAIASLVFALLIVVFVVPPLARSARAEAARLDLPFQVTAGGVVFVSVFTVVAFAAWNTGNNLLFLVFSVLASTLFVALTAGRASLRDLVVTATRESETLDLGVSPRGTLALFRAAQALAVTEGRDYCVPDDVKRLIIPVFAHRLVVNSRFSSSLHRRSDEAEEVLREIMKTVSVPL